MSLIALSPSRSIAIKLNTDPVELRRSISAARSSWNARWFESPVRLSVRASVMSRESSDGWIGACPIPDASSSASDQRTSEATPISAASAIAPKMR